MDGINVCLVKSNGIYLEPTKQTMIHTYTKKTRMILQDIVFNFNTRIFNKDFMNELTFLVTLDHLNAVKSVLKDSKIVPELIGFHGQIISNFRDNDLRNGGQGAPIAPIYHKYLMEKLKIERPSCFINIGGVANISYWDNQKLIGFDTGPGNGLMDIFIQKYLNKKFDKDGELASNGKINHKLLKIFLSNKYFSKIYPKTLDRSYFDNFIDIIIKNNLHLKDALATLSELTAQTIKMSLDHLPNTPKSIIVMGGGIFNIHLMNRISSLIPVKILKANDIGLNGEMIEAELIAFLSARSIYNLPFTFPSTTGVSEASSGGKIYNYL